MAAAETKRRGTGQSSRFPDPKNLRERDLASDVQGKNRLQGDDQESVRNERRSVPQVGGATGKGRPDEGSDNE